MHVVYRQTCRVCGSPCLTEVIDLGEQYLQGSFIKPGKELPPMRKIPTSLVRCDPRRDEKACGLLQLSQTLPPEILYSAYWYRSGTNQTMREHLKGIAEEATRIIGRDEVRVLDIGCNDGTLLSYYPRGFEKLGIDPSDVAQDVPAEIKVIHGLFPSEEITESAKGKPFDIITSIAMFYDLEDPIDFAQSVKRSLAENGVWCLELSYMPSMLTLGSYDTICQEHLEYYSLAVLEYILARAAMKVIKADLNDINGGSIRCYATHRNNFAFKGIERQAQPELAALRLREFEMELDSDKPYREFQDRINILRHELISVVTQIKSQGGKIHLYGASTKGNTILQFCGLDKTIIDYAAERNPDKFGARTLGSDIPIISEAESRAMRPDYYLVLPWHFKKEFLERERETLKQGTGMIFPLPKVEVVRA
jgi:SAM-dependent methyltransferase